MVRKWVRQFNDGRINVHDEALRQPSVDDDLVEKVNEHICKIRRFTTVRLPSDKFPTNFKNCFA